MPNARRACDNRLCNFEQILVVLASLETSKRPEAISYQQQAIYLHQVHQQCRLDSEEYYLSDRTSFVMSASVTAVPDS